MVGRRAPKVRYVHSERPKLKEKTNKASVFLAHGSLGSIAPTRGLYYFKAKIALVQG